MPAVYAWDSGRQEAVKIKKVGSRYCIYGLRKVIKKKLPYSFDEGWKESYKFVWDTSSRDCSDYKPYEDRDVTNKPEIFIDDIKRWSQHKIESE